MQTAKLHTYFASAVILLALFPVTLLAEDYRWVKRSYSWHGTGVRSTEPVKVFGDDIRIRIWSPQRGPLKVTIHDVNPDASARRASRVLFKESSLQRAASKELTGYREFYLTIEGDSRQWIVELDQYLDRIGEWRYLSYTKTLPEEMLKEATWAGDEAQRIDYSPRKAPYQLRCTQSGAGKLRIAAYSADNTLLFENTLNSDGATAAGWIYTLGDATIIAEGAEGTSWRIEALSK